MNLNVFKYVLLSILLAFIVSQFFGLQFVGGYTHELLNSKWFEVGSSTGIVWAVYFIIAFFLAPFFFRYACEYHRFVINDGYKLCAHEFDYFLIFIISLFAFWLHFYAPYVFLEHDFSEIFVGLAIAYLFFAGLPRIRQLPFTCLSIVSLYVAVVSLHALRVSSLDECLVCLATLFIVSMHLVPWLGALKVLQSVAYLNKLWKGMRYGVVLYKQDVRYQNRIGQSLPAFVLFYKGVIWFSLKAFCMLPFRRYVKPLPIKYNSFDGFSEFTQDGLGLSKEDKAMRAFLRAYRTTEKLSTPFLIQDNEIAPVDILGRKRFIEGVAKNIRSYLGSLPTTEALTIGVCGEWGDGKSYAVHALFDEFRRTGCKYICIRTFPWRYFISNNDEAILHGFVSDIEGEVFKKVRSLKFKKLLKRYVNLLSTGVASYGGKGFEFNFDFLRLNDNFLSVSTAIQAELDKSGYKLVIAIEDLDRMSFDEVIKVLRLVRSVVDFKNTVFLIPYDKARVNNLLRQEKIGREYLQKFIQTEVHLPPVRAEVIQRYIASEIKERWAISNSNGRPIVDSKEIDKVVEEIFDNRQTNFVIRNLRHAKRLLNGILLPYIELHEEVSLIEFIELEILKLYYPEVYDDILESIEYYLPQMSSRIVWGGNQNLVDACNSHLEKVMTEALYSDKEKSVVRELINDLFPHFATGSVSTGGSRKYRLHNTRYFLRYFEGRVSPDQIANIKVATVKSDVAAIVGEGAQVEVLHSELSSMYVNGRIGEFLAIAFENKDESSKAFFRILTLLFIKYEDFYSSKDDARNRDFVITHFQSALSLVYPDEQREIIDAAISRFSLYRAMMLIHYLNLDAARKEGVFGPNIDEGYRKEKQQFLVERFLWELVERRVNLFNADGIALKAASFIWYVISLWMKEDLRLAEYILTCLKDNHVALENFVEFYKDDDGFDKGYFHRATLTPKIKKLLRLIRREDERAAGILEYLSEYIRENDESIG